MTKFFLKLTIAITFILTIISLAARALGCTQPPNPALRGFIEGCESKPQPCWYGIARSISIEEVKEIVLKYGFKDTSTPAYNPYYSALNIEPDQYNKCGASLLFDDLNRLIDFDLHYCSNFRFGDFINYFGSPEITYDCSYVDMHGVGARPLTIVYDVPFTLTFGTIFIENEKFITSPNWMISDISSHMPARFIEPLIRWRGFIPMWRFRQLESTRPDCTQ